MAKKEVRSRSRTAVKAAKKSSAKFAARSSSKTPSLGLLFEKLEAIEARLGSIETLSKKEYAEEEKVEQEEEVQLSELKKLEELEHEIEEQVKESPVKKITYHDFSKSAIGAFFGILGHFSFFYGVELSKDISVARAGVLYVVAFLIGAMFLYTTGYRTSSKNGWFMLLRLLIIYVTSLVTIIIVLFLFDFASLSSSFVELFKTVATISILAVIGAITADLIGRDKE